VSGVTNYLAGESSAYSTDFGFGKIEMTERAKTIGKCTLCALAIIGVLGLSAGLIYGGYTLSAPHSIIMAVAGIGVVPGAMLPLHKGIIQVQRILRMNN
jgi:hypothetical protein